MRIIAGLETPDQGRVHVNGVDITDRHASRRGIGFVFQHYALFRHMTVFDNIAFGLRVKSRKERPTEAYITKKVHSLLELVQLDWLAERFPDQLSGGQRQRIGLARALALNPDFIVCDEITSALDVSVQAEILQLLLQIRQQRQLTLLFITHNIGVVEYLSDHTVVMYQGKIVEQGQTAQICSQPQHPYTQKLLAAVPKLPMKKMVGGWATIRMRASN